MFGLLACGPELRQLEPSRLIEICAHHELPDRDRYKLGAVGAIANIFGRVGTRLLGGDRSTKHYGAQ
jgi:hypothetical protein